MKWRERVCARKQAHAARGRHKHHRRRHHRELSQNRPGLVTVTLELLFLPARQPMRVDKDAAVQFGRGGAHLRVKEESRVRRRLEERRKRSTAAHSNIWRLFQLPIFIYLCIYTTQLPPLLLLVPMTHIAAALGARAVHFVGRSTFSFSVGSCDVILDAHVTCQLRYITGAGARVAGSGLRGRRWMVDGGWWGRGAFEMRAVVQVSTDQLADKSSPPSLSLCVHLRAWQRKVN